MEHQENPVGKAYAFFYCRASKQEIEAKFPRIRELAQTPSELELSLTEGMDNINEIKYDERLAALAKEAKQSDINYMLQATCPNRTNADTANELATIVNQAYQSPLYQPEEEFKGSTAYEEKGEYVFIE